MWNAETLDFSLREWDAIQDKVQKLREALGDSAVTPENLTKAMLECGRRGDYETMLEQNLRIKKGIDAMAGERQRHLAGEDTVQLEATARDLTDQFVEEAGILWNDPRDARAAAEKDPFLTAVVLNWAQEEGDIQSELPPEVLGIQTAAANQAVKHLIENDWDWQEFRNWMLETVTTVLLLASTILVMVGFGGEVAVVSAELLVVLGYGMILTAAVICIVEDYWDELTDYFTRVRDFWRKLFRGETAQAQYLRQTCAVTLPVVEEESEAYSYA